MTTDKNNAAPDPQPAELAEQQGVGGYDKLADLIARLYMARDMERAGAWSYLFAEAADALAATGKQQVGEVQGDAHSLAALAAQVGAFEYGDPDARYYDFSAEQLVQFAALAARQPGAQVPAAYMVRWRTAGGWGLNMPHEIQWFRDRADEYEIRDLVFADAAPPAQGIDLGRVREIRIPARNNLDPISVFVQDQAAGRGRIVVTCYGNAWQGFWGAMGDRTVMEFVAQCDADYVAGNMISGRQTRMTKTERAYTERIAAEVIDEFRALLGQRDAAPGVGNG